MQKKSSKILFVTAVLLVLAPSLYFNAPKKAEAFQILGTGASFDDIAAPVKEVESIILMALNRAFVSGFLQKAQDKYKINNYLQYVANLSDMVGVADMTLQDNPTETYKVKKIIQRMRGQSTADTDAELQKIYSKEASEVAIVSPDQIARQNAVDFQVKLEQASNFILSTPQGRELMANDRAQQVMATADAAAVLSLQAKGSKDRFQCLISAAGDATLKAANKVSCVVRQPADYIISLIDSKIQRDDKEQTVPNFTMAGFIKVIAQSAANKLANKVLSTNSSSNNLIDDINRGTANALGSK